MKRKVLLLLMLTCSLSVTAQQPAGAEESRNMIEQVCEAAGELASLQCDFRQTKRLSLLQTDMVSAGRMCYKGGRLLRWEYVSPYQYVFVINGDKVMIKSAQKTDVVDVKSSRMFQQIARIMMNSVTGRCLTDTEDFSVTMLKQGGEWLARLVPRQREMARMFAHVLLHIDPQARMVTQVELVEKAGDTTHIEMTNIRKNEPVSEEAFAVE